MPSLLKVPYISKLPQTFIKVTPVVKVTPVYGIYSDKDILRGKILYEMNKDYTTMEVFPFS